MSESVLRIGSIYPFIFGSYGDRGNATVLLERARRRGVLAELVQVDLGTPVPEDLDIYVMGGFEDGVQVNALQQFQRYSGLKCAATKGAPILAVSAAMQILGTTLVDIWGTKVGGLGLLDIDTEFGGHRTTGELVLQPLLEGLTDPLTGFENHGGTTVLGSDAFPLGVSLGGTSANVDVKRQEGAVQGNIIGTYLHGPVLARNPQLADHLLKKVVGGTLKPLDVPGVELLRAERLRAVGCHANSFT